MNMIITKNKMKNNANNGKIEKKMKNNEVNLLSKRIMTNNDTMIC